VAPWRRHTARVLPVDADGRVLLLHGWDPRHPDRPFWFTIGGGAEAGESLRDAGARELREETGIVVDPACLGEPIAQNMVEFSWAGYEITQDQTLYAWLSADDLGPDMPPADPSLPGLIRAAAVSVRDRRSSGS
jgi:8-oxo-dGTP pyrophosphatase MutT (NUDIX family)